MRCTTQRGRGPSRPRRPWGSCAGEAGDGILTARPFLGRQVPEEPEKPKVSSQGLRGNPRGMTHNIPDTTRPTLPGQRGLPAQRLLLCGFRPDSHLPCSGTLRALSASQLEPQSEGDRSGTLTLLPRERRARTKLSETPGDETEVTSGHRPPQKPRVCAQSRVGTSGASEREHACCPN